jgi:hypothetical protein
VEVPAEAALVSVIWICYHGKPLPSGRFRPDLAKVMKDFKSFTARRIVDALEANRETMLLELLGELKAASRMQSDYQVWQAGYHPKEIAHEEMLRQ